MKNDLHCYGCLHLICFSNLSAQNIPSPKFSFWIRFIGRWLEACQFFSDLRLISKKVAIASDKSSAFKYRKDRIWSVTNQLWLIQAPANFQALNNIKTVSQKIRLCWNGREGGWAINRSGEARDFWIDGDCMPVNGRSSSIDPTLYEFRRQEQMRRPWRFWFEVDHSLGTCEIQRYGEIMSLLVHAQRMNPYQKGIKIIPILYQEIRGMIK